MTVKKLVTLAAITVAAGASATPAAMAATDSVRPAPRPASSIECQHTFGSIWMCQAKWSGGSSEWVCDTVSKVCVKQ
ncbi:MAG: hypothetical protein WKF48_11340 [Solirubrobacteraceae bacterium]